MRSRAYMLQGEIQVNGKDHEVFFLVDSGSEMNVIRSNLVKDIPKEGCDILMRAAGGRVVKR